MEPTQTPVTPPPAEPGTVTLPQPVQNALDAARSALQQVQQHLTNLEQEVGRHL